MSKIVLDHYPTANLPDDMRHGLGDVGEVRVTIETSSGTRPAGAVDPDDRPVAKPGLFSKYRHLAKQRFSSMEDVVDHVRVLRDEWDHRDR